MKYYLLFIAFCIGVSATAQNKLVFINVDNSETITISQKDLVKFSYAGYMGQQQELEGTVSAIGDSSIQISPPKKFLKKKGAEQSILIRDITGFRRFSNFRPTAEIIYGVAGVGITGAVAAIISEASVPTALTFLSAAGTQAVTSALKNAIFPKKINYHLDKGWSMDVIADK
ncbi:MAG TPA: hypothetical protein VLZ28_07110 [Daejeonella sp.]|nr:hypothetical protein [Daejeonella sp.]